MHNRVLHIMGRESMVTPHKQNHGVKAVQVWIQNFCIKIVPQNFVATSIAPQQGKQEANAFIAG